MPHFTDNRTARTFAAARAGHAESAHLAAVMAATGAGLTPSWTMALDYLTRAAVAGDASAGAELALLASARAEKTAAPQKLREAIDLHDWLKPPPAVWIKTSPRLAVMENFIDSDVCDWLIARAAPRLMRATVQDASSPGARYDGSRTNSHMSFMPLERDLVLAMVRARIAAAVGLPSARLEDSAVLHYQPGQLFAPHFDFLHLDVPVHVDVLAIEGQRVATFLIYLNEEFEGGETSFPNTAWSFKGKKGDALMFWNVLPTGEPDPLTLHAGMPPTRGEKWLFSQWIRQPAVPG